MDETLYTVKIYFKDITGKEHEKTVVCKGCSCAEELIISTYAILKRMRKHKLITVNEVTCCPPLPK